MKAFFFKHLIVSTLLIFASISLTLMLINKQTVFMINTLEGFFILYGVGAYLWIKSRKIGSVLLIRTATFVYLIASYSYAVLYREVDVLDFLMAYKSFVYLYFLTFLVDKTFVSVESYLKLFNIILVIYFLKYLIMVGIGRTTRPTVYMENNFELMLLYALYLLRYSYTKKNYLPILILLGGVTLISLSRSSLLMFAVLGLFVCWDSFKKTRVFIIPVAALIMGVLVYYIFSQRSGSLEEVDRYKFFLVFLDHTKNWNFWEYMVGADRITPLGYYACKSLSFYKNLFSYSGDGSCYSVILHSFLLRIIIDHGVLGLIFILSSTFIMLRRSGVRLDVSLIFISIVVVNGLSVSSFNNLFFALSMVLLMVSQKVYLEHADEPLNENTKPILE